MVSIIDKLRFARGSLMLEAESKQEARDYVSQSQLWASQFEQDVYIFYPGCKSPYKVYSKEQIKMTQLIIPDEHGYVITKTLVTPTLHRAMGFFLENPEAKGGVVRLSDERQIIMSRASADLVASTNLENAVERKREDYWFLPDLQEFRTRFTRQTLEANNPDSSCEHTFRIFDPITRNNWRKNINRYQLIEDERGDLYHLFVHVGFEPIPSPLVTVH